MADFEQDDVIRIGCVLQVSGAYEVVNVLNVIKLDGTSRTFAQLSPDIQEYCDALYATIEGRQTDLLTGKHISIKNMTQLTVWGNIAWDTYAGGTEVAEPTALQVACLGFGRTPLSRVQIRKYLGVFTELNLVDGAWDGTVRGACDNFMTYHIASQALTGGLNIQGIAYRPSDGRVVYATSAATSVQPVIQRRRRRGRGS